MLSDQFISKTYSSLSEMCYEVARLSDAIEAKQWAASSGAKAVAIEDIAGLLDRSTSRLCELLASEAARTETVPGGGQIGE